MEAEDRAHLLEQVFDYYGLQFPSGVGERSARCPCHDDRTASASVNTSEGLLNCHACGAAGDGFNVIMINERLAFTDAKRFAEEVLNFRDESVREGSRRKPGRGVPGGKKRKSGGGSYRPSWLRKDT